MEDHPTYTVEQFLEKQGFATKNPHIAHAFKHTILIEDKHVTVKRSRKEWAQKFNEWLSKPRY